MEQTMRYLVMALTVIIAADISSASPARGRSTNLDSGQNRTKGWSDLFSQYSGPFDRRRGIDCVYEGKTYEEGALVATTEPCLKCRCVRGSVVCYLRVCPTLPDPPPPHCVSVLRNGACCSELICEDSGISTNHISRAEPNGIDLPPERTSFGEGCIDNGTLYGTGSAMSTSSLCEYCYCIAGVQRCVKPRCLMPLDGCTPKHSPLSCCPIRYDCAHAVASTTTTLAPSPFNGCEIDGVMYPEGERVMGVNQSPCDNCFCMRGLVRCVPMSCAPPLLDCTPIVLPGKCCASSYNCSKKVAEFKANNELLLVSESGRDNVEHEVIINERSFPDDTPLTPSQIASLLLNLDGRNNRRIENKSNITAHNKSQIRPKTVANVTASEKSNTTEKNELTTTERVTDKPTNISTTLIAIISTTTRYTSKNSTTIKNDIDITDIPIIKTKLNGSISTENTTLNTASEIVTEKSDTALIKDSNNTLTKEDESLGDFNATIKSSLLDKSKTIINDTVNCTTEISTIEGNVSLSNDERNNSLSDLVPYNDTQERRKNIFDEIEATNSSLDEDEEDFTTFVPTEVPLETITSENDVSSVDSQFPSTSLIIPKDDDIFMVNVSTYVRTNTSVVTLRPVAAIPPDIEALLNISMKKNSQKDDYYDYDYKSSLPPSLPNLEIIPFLAIDAVLKSDEREPDKSKELDHYATAYPPLDQEKSYLSSFSTIPREKYNATAYPYITGDTYNPTTFASYTEEKFLSSPTNFPPVRTNNNFARNPAIYKQHINDKFQATTYKTIIDENIKYEASQYARDKYDPTIYPSLTLEETQTDTPSFAFDAHSLNLFSPPVETEGGFLPRDPPSINPYYDLEYSSSDDGAHSATESSMMVTNHAKTNTDDCTSNGRDYKNGQLITEPSACVVCFCYYGDIHCQDPECPAIKPGCRRIIEKGVQSCCGVEICNEEVEKSTPSIEVSENEIKTHKPLELVTIADRIDTPDPFKDVIRTEPAPDLQSLIVDMLPYYVRQTPKSTISDTQTPTVTKIPTFVVPSRTSKPQINSPVSFTTEATLTTTEAKIETTSNFIKLESIPKVEATKFPLEIPVFKTLPTTESYKTTTEEIEVIPEEEEEDEGFSFDSVLKLLLGDSSDSTPKPTTIRTTRYTNPTTQSTTTTARPTTTSSTTTTRQSTTESTTLRPTTARTTITTQLPSSNSSLLKNSYKYSFTKPNRTLGSVSLLHKNFTKPAKGTTKSPSAYHVINRPTKLKYPFASTQIPLTTQSFKKVPIPINDLAKPLVSRLPPSVAPESAIPFGSGLLKLAGCNIYGRMYRVGKIISKLSGPCLECMCTEVGVQCTPLTC